jgi:EmrB/QacA subfamily drug resistance transporter
MSPERPGQYKLALLAICGSVFLAFLDTTIVNTSFPDIQRGFHGVSPAALSWVLDGYFIALAALLVPAGGVADRLGRRRVFLAGVALFTVMSALCAVAPSWQILVGARVLQGTGAAIMVPASLALLLPLFAPERRASGVGIWGAAAALAAAIGPPLGGLLVAAYDWRLIFLVNVPLGALVLVAGSRSLRESRDPAAQRLPDLAGAALAACSLGLVALGLVEGNTWGWSSAATLGCLATSVLLLGAVGVRCLSHPRPIVDLALLRIPSFRQGTLGTLLFATAFFSMILGNILFLTRVWGYSVLSAGLAVAPGPLASAIVAIPAGRLADRFGHRAIIVPGTLIYAAGLLVLRGVGLHPDYLGQWLPGQLLTGAGIGLAFPTLGAAAAAAIPAERFGAASALTAAGRQLGAVLGTAVLFAIIGTPHTLAQAGHAASHAYLFGVCAALLSGMAVLGLRKQPGSAPPAEPNPADGRRRDYRTPSTSVVNSA